MPRKLITALSELRVSDTIMHNNSRTLAPLPVEESDVESPTEDVPTTKPALAEKNDEAADAPMKDEDDDEEEDDDDDDPETSVQVSMAYCALLIMA